MGVAGKTRACLQTKRHRTDTQHTKNALTNNL
jgi:hypothetical protein